MSCSCSCTSCFSFGRFCTWLPCVLHSLSLSSFVNLFCTPHSICMLQNLIRGRGVFCRSMMKSQLASPTFTPTYAALVAIINTKFPEIGELLLKRVISQVSWMHHGPALLKLAKHICKSSVVIYMLTPCCDARAHSACLCVTWQESSSISPHAPCSQLP